MGILKQVPAQVGQFLKEQRMANLATVSASGIPEVALVYYYFMEESMYIVTHTESHKIQNVKNNPKVALSISQEIPPITLQIHAHAELLSDTHKKSEIIQYILDVANADPKSLNWPPFVLLPGKQLEVVKLTIEWYRYSNFETNKPLIIEENSDE